MEVEVRAFIKDFSIMKKKLISIGAKKVDSTKITDLWYCPKQFTNFSQIKMNAVGTYSLRIRLQEKRKPELNVKAMVRENDHQIYDEYETNFNDLAHMKKILEMLGQKIYCVIQKKRETYKYQNMLINLEDINGFLPCIEIEIMTKGKFDSHKQKIHKILDLLGIKESERIKESIAGLFMEKYAFKQNI